MLDVHVLTMPDTPAAWVAERRASLCDAVASAGYPVTIREIRGAAGHIGEGRERGYALGSAPYVTYVDDDDFVLPRAFAALLPPMLSGCDAAYPWELLWRNGHIQEARHRHHLAVYRREIACGFDHSAWRACGDLALQEATSGVEITEFLYVHRVYVSGGRRLRWSVNELERARA